MKNIDSNEKSDDNHISTETLEEIHDGGQTHPNVDKRESRLLYVIVLSKGNCNGKER